MVGRFDYREARTPDSREEHASPAGGSSRGYGRPCGITRSDYGARSRDESLAEESHGLCVAGGRGCFGGRSEYGRPNYRDLGNRHMETQLIALWTLEDVIIVMEPRHLLVVVELLDPKV